MKKAEETVALSDAQKKTLTDNVASLTEELSSICVERDNLKPDLDEMTVMEQRLKNDDGKWSSNVSMEVQKTYDDTVEAVKLNMQADLVNGLKRVQVLFQFEYGCLAVHAGDELLL